MRFTVHLPAPENSVYEQGCFDQNVGKTIPLTVGFSQKDVLGAAKVVNTRVLDDGSAVEVTLEIDADISISFNRVTHDVVETAFISNPQKRQ